MMNLHLVLAHHWFDLIKSGEKRVEYREMSDYWRKRIWYKLEDIKTVTFARAYTSETLTFNVDCIDMGSCPYPEWNEEYYRIHFSTITTKHNQ